jgi:hypothetical protein
MKVPIQIDRYGTIGVVNLNRRKAIRWRCRNCVGWESFKIGICNYTKCPLHLYRSGNGNQNAKAREKAIREYCLWCCAKQRKEVYKCSAKHCPLFVFRKTQIDKTFVNWIEVEIRAYRDHFWTELEKDISLYGKALYSSKMRPIRIK